jgi:hypothetical protein
LQRLQGGCRVYRRLQGLQGLQGTGAAAHARGIRDPDRPFRVLRPAPEAHDMIELSLGVIWLASAIYVLGEIAQAPLNE